MPSTNTARATFLEPEMILASQQMLTISLYHPDERLREQAGRKLIGKALLEGWPGLLAYVRDNPDIPSSVRCEASKEFGRPEFVKSVIGNLGFPADMRAAATEELFRTIASEEIMQTCSFNLSLARASGPTEARIYAGTEAVSGFANLECARYLLIMAHGPEFELTVREYAVSKLKALAVVLGVDFFGNPDMQEFQLMEQPVCGSNASPFVTPTLSSLLSDARVAYSLDAQFAILLYHTEDSLREMAGAEIMEHCVSNGLPEVLCYLKGTEDRIPERTRAKAGARIEQAEANRLVLDVALIYKEDKNDVSRAMQAADAFSRLRCANHLLDMADDEGLDADVRSYAESKLRILAHAFVAERIKTGISHALDREFALQTKDATVLRSQIIGAPNTSPRIRTTKTCS
jgi:hypothetical protein